MARTRTALEIDAEIAKLQKEREDARASEKAGVIDRMKTAIAYYGITAGDLGLGVATRKGRKTDTAPDAAAANGTARTSARGGRIKYRDDAGHSWSGYGPKPRWFTEALASGKTEEELRA